MVRNEMASPESDLKPVAVQGEEPGSAKGEVDQVPSESPEALASQCLTDLQSFPGKMGKSTEQLQAVCSQVAMLNGCRSVEGRPIYHFEKVPQSQLAALQSSSPELSDLPSSSSHPQDFHDPSALSKRAPVSIVSTANTRQQQHSERVLVFSLIHGDERPSGTVAREWMLRLSEIDPRNHWRIIPLLNPDGYLRNTRTNARGIDLNRNFPSADWDELALLYWKTKAKSHPRRFPGDTPGSEPEVHCVSEHIGDFQPNLIVAVHTPLGVLDFDGPKSTRFPKYEGGLPWKSLGTFPGSLGRWMWVDKKVPVMTVELKGNSLAALQKIDELQDVSGTLAKGLRGLGSQNED